MVRSLTACPEWWDTRVAPRIVVLPDGCHEWVGGRLRGGYGQLSIPMSVARLASGSAVSVKAHRATYVRAYGPPEFGMTLDHLCRFRPCVNPQHLEPVPIGVNSMRASGTVNAANAAKVLCPRCGGPLTPVPARPHHRHCEPCYRKSSRESASRGYAAVSAAFKALGLRYTDYRPLFGQSAKVAEFILDQLANGADPAELIAMQRAKRAAIQSLDDRRDDLQREPEAGEVA